MSLKSAAVLRETQRTIIDNLLDKQQQMIVAGMGAGKTVSILTAFAQLQEEGEVRKGIILAPPRVVDLIWPRECAKWEHLQHLKVVPVRGTPAQRLKQLEQDADLYAVSLNSLKWLADIAKKWARDDPRFDLLAIDEISKLKDPRSKMSKYAFDKKLWPAFQNIWGATGTIKPNGYEDLWQPYRIVSNGAIWGGQAFDEWRRERFMPLDQTGYNWRIHTFTKTEVDRKVAAFTTAVQADLGLPEMNVGTDWDLQCPLGGDQEKAYDAMLEELLVQVGYDDHLEPEMVAALSAAIQSGKLSQIVQGFLMDKRLDEDDGSVTSRVVKTFDTNVKLDVIKEHVDILRDERDPPIICYHFKHDLELLKKTFPDFGHLGSGVTPRGAVKTMDAWNEGRLPGVLAHPASVGHGVEMQHGGRTMLWFTPTWSSEMWDQMIKRIHRPGQTRPCIVRRLVSPRTTDVIKVNRVEHKVDELRAFEDFLKEWTNARKTA